MTGGYHNPLDPRFVSLFMGKVVDANDPEKLGRVRVWIPGLVPATPWAYPIGTLGGGSDRSGFFAVPEKDADVAVFFNHGDINQPYYLSGHWGRPPNGETEVPTPIRDLSAEDAPRVRALETKNFLLVFDDRDGKETLLIKDKRDGGAQFKFDPNLGVTIEAVSLNVKVDGQVNIRGLNVLINGRPVAPGGKPI